MPLGEAVCKHQLGTWRPNQWSRKSGDTDGGQVIKERSRLEEEKPPEALWMPTLQATTVHPVAERQLTSTEWWASGGPLEEGGGGPLVYPDIPSAFSARRLMGSCHGQAYVEH